ncbi:hypothetical protein SBADM41S_11168 [Streptomyces badius]
MPIAPTGPSARLLVRSLSSRASKPAATVAALAVIGPKDSRSAIRMAVNRSPWTASSSRNRAVSSSAVRRRADHQDHYALHLAATWRTMSWSAST